MENNFSLMRCLARLCLALFAGMATATTQASANSTNNPVVVKVSGLGLFGNRETARLLRSFQSGRDRPKFIDRAFVEDSALVLLSRAQSDGYLNAKLQARFTFLDGSRRTMEWTNAVDVSLARDFAA